MPPRCRVTARTASRSRACRPLRNFASAGIVGIRRCPLDPDIAAFEKLALPDRGDLFHALDGVSARGARVGAMRGRRGDGDAGLPDLEAADAMMQCQPDARPPDRDLGGDALERFAREWFVRVVLEISDSPAHVAVPD